MNCGQKPNEGDVPLSGRLAEFRAALQDEIDAARRKEASSAVPLANGRRKAQIGGNYQYTFEVENLLNLPGDAPGDLRVPGRPPQAVVVICVEGMTITLGISVDLGPFIPNARLQSNMAHLMRKLIERIEGLASVHNAVGDRIFGDAPTLGKPVALSELADWNSSRDRNRRLNKEQLRSVASSLGRDTTFIWGPPGTGKALTIGAIGQHLHRRQRSALLVSHTNTAVDQAILCIADSIDKSELEAGHVLRVGEPHDGRFKGREYQELLLETHVDRRSAQLAARRDQCTAKRQDAAERIAEIDKLIGLTEWAAEAESDISDMAQELSSIVHMEAQLEQARREHLALLSQNAQWEAVAEEARLANDRLAEIKKLRDMKDAMAVVLKDAGSLLTVAQEALQKAEDALSATTSANWFTRRWRGLPDPDKQRDEVGLRHKEADGARIKYENVKGRVALIKKTHARLAAEVKAFIRKRSGSPDEIISRAAKHTKRMDYAAQCVGRLQRQSSGRRKKLGECSYSLGGNGARLGVVCGSSSWCRWHDRQALGCP